MNHSDFEQQVQELIARHQWQALRQGCEAAELASANDSNVKPHYSLQLLSYLLLGDLSLTPLIAAFLLSCRRPLSLTFQPNQSDSARFLWKRLPAKIKKDSQELSAIWAVGKGMWKNQYTEVYQPLLSTAWDASLKPLIEALVDSFRAKSALLIANSYNNISEQTASHLLGLSEAETVAYCMSLDWTHDAATKSFTPKLPAKPEAQTLGADQLNTLTSYVVTLERK